MYTNLSLSGGAHFCIAFLGFLRVARDLLRNVRHMSLSSGGALVGIAHALRVPDDTLIRIMEKHLSAGVFGRVDLAELIASYGLVDGDECMVPMIKDVLAAGVNRWITVKNGWWLDGDGPPEDITMVQFVKLTGVDVAIAAADVAAYFRMTFITAETHPDLKVYEAVRASCSVPLVVTPARLPDGRMYADACVCDSSVSEYFERVAPNPSGIDTLSLRVRMADPPAPDGGWPPSDVLEYLRHFAVAMGRRLLESSSSERCTVVTIPRWTDDIMGPLVSGISPTDISAAYDLGMRTGQDFIERVDKEP